MNEIITGLIKAGATPHHFRLEKPVARKGIFHFTINGSQFEFFLSCHATEQILGELRLMEET